MIIKSCCVTGHREIPSGKLQNVELELRQKVQQAVSDGYTDFISGFAKGADLIFAAIVVEMKQTNSDLKLEAALPYRARLDHLYGTPETARLLRACDGISVHSEEQNPGCYGKRNHFMVDACERVIAVYDGRSTGGTAATIRYATEKGREVQTIEI